MLIPLLLCARTNKKLHFHLLKFPHAENELAGYNLIPECFSNLCNAKRNFHSSCFLHVQKVYKNSLCCFRPQINFIGFFTYTSYLSGEHKVELPHICPV